MSCKKLGVLLFSVGMTTTACKMAETDNKAGNGALSGPPGSGAFETIGNPALNVAGPRPGPTLQLGLRASRTLPNTIKAIVTNNAGQPMPGINVKFTALQAQTEAGEPFAGGMDGMVVPNGIASSDWQYMVGPETNVATDATGTATAYVDSTTPGVTKFRVSTAYTPPQYVEFGKPGIVVNDYYLSRSNIKSISVTPLRVLQTVEIAQSLSTSTPRIKLTRLSQAEPRIVNVPPHQYKVYDSNENHPVDLSKAVVTTSPAAIRIEFPNGIGGSNTDAVGNGLYKLTIDENGTGNIDATYYFHRLSGDVDGNSKVDSRDVDYGAQCPPSAGMAAIQGNRCINADANNDGVTDRKDSDMSAQFRDYRIGI